MVFIFDIFCIIIEIQTDIYFSDKMDTHRTMRYLSFTLYIFQIIILERIIHGSDLCAGWICLNIFIKLLFWNVSLKVVIGRV